MSDFRFSNHGSICLLDPVTPAAQDWVDENLPEDAMQHWGRAVAIEPRYAVAILDGIVARGMTVKPVGMFL